VAAAFPAFLDGMACNATSVPFRHAFRRPRTLDRRVIHLQALGEVPERHAPLAAGSFSCCGSFPFGVQDMSGKPVQAITWCRRCRSNG
jgi:hypothetical protein